MAEVKVLLRQAADREKKQLLQIDQLKARVSSCLHYVTAYIVNFSF